MLNKNSLVVLLSLLIIGLFFLFLNERNKTQSLSYQAKLDSINYRASTDSLTSKKGKDGIIESSKTSFDAKDLNDLKKLNYSLYESVKAMNGKVFALQNSIVEIKESVNQQSKGDNSSFDKSSHQNTINWSFDTTATDGTWYRRAHGYTKFKIDSLYNVTPSGSVLTGIENKFKLTTALRKSEKINGALEIVVKSNSPFFTVSDVEGAIISSDELTTLLPSAKKKKYVFGLSGVVGVGVDNSGRISPSFTIGLGITKKIKEF